MRKLGTLWEMSDMRDLFSFVLWGLLWATKRDPSQNREGEGGQALGGRQANQKINNQIEDGVWDGGEDR